MDVEHSRAEGANHAELADRIRSCDPAAEEEFVFLFRRRIQAMAFARTREREVAQELADDVLMAVLLALRKGSVREPDRLPGFVFRTALNLINNYLRRRSRRPAEVPLPDFELTDPEWEASGRWTERHELMRRAVSQLGDPDRQILRLTLVDGMRAVEIADQLGMTPEGVRQRKARAIKRVRFRLAGEYS